MLGENSMSAIHLPRVGLSNLFSRSKSTRENHSQLRKEELFLPIPPLALASLAASTALTVTFFADGVYGLLKVQRTTHCFQ